MSAQSPSDVAPLTPDDGRLLIESVSDYAIFMLDPEGRVVTWNPGAERIQGYKAGEIVGQHFSRFYVPVDIEAGKPELELKTAREFGRLEDEGYRVRKDGSLFWANSVVTALRDAQGRLRGFAKVTKDMTARREAENRAREMEEQLRRSEERARLLVESVTDYAIYMLDPEGYVTTWNVGAERMKGFQAHEVIGRHFAVFFPDEDVRLGKPGRELSLALSTGHFEEEGVRIRRNGSRFWARVVLTPMRGPGGELLGFAKVTRDLTERETARTVEVALRRAEETNRVKDEFLATVSHELRTPLTAILGWAAVIRQKKVDEQLLKATDAIHRNAVAQAKIIEDILDVSRIITGKLRLDAKRVDLVAIVSEALDTVRTSASAKSITLEFSPPDEPLLLVGDSERLRQIVWNLLSNAVKFTPVCGRVRVVLERDGSSIALAVADTGRGIEPEFLPYVFDRFQQADASTTRRHGGLGLGLAIVRHLVELHGGDVRVESAGTDQGSVFRVTLPVRATLPQAEPADAHAPATAPEATPHSERVDALKGVRVLVVDDDRDARSLLHDVFTGVGASVETASSARAAFTAFRTFKPDLLVSDIGMPDEDGYSLIRRIRALPASEGSTVPAIALSAYVRRDDQSKALRAGFTAHVGKPVDPADLVTAASNLVALPA